MPFVGLLSLRGLLVLLWEDLFHFDRHLDLSYCFYLYVIP